MTNSKNMPHVVYWLHDERCVCVWRHGYIGITYRPTQRLQQHRGSGRFSSNLQWTVLFIGTRLQCRQIEFKLRPTQDIGWNHAPGGNAVSEQARRKIRLRALQPDQLERLRIKRENPKRLINLRAVMTRPKSEEWRNKIAATLTGHTRTEASRAKQSASAKGNPKSPEWRDRMSTIASSQGRGKERSPTEERARLAKNAKRAARRAAGLPRLY
jgi:hypothetical protein